jgi:glycosyltransferase involved in cell wall biosynthesis
VIGTLCVLRPEKGLYTLLEAFAQLAPGERGIRLAIVGSGPEREGLMARAAALGVAGECVFQPATSQVGQWLGAMDVFVMPSYDEAFSNAIMEAMACGCAVAASDVGGNPELVAPDRGLVVPPRDAASLATAIGQLLDDDALRTRLACAARVFVRDHLSREKAAARLAEIYDGLLEDSSHRP